MFVLPDLPYPYEALEPIISAQTLRFHHDRHHKAYVDTLNTLLAEAGEAAADLETVVLRAAEQGRSKLFNNAAQAWNHAFFWDCMSPQRAAPQGALAAAVAAFGGLAAVREAFVAEGAGHFASGWVWLAAEDGGLKILSTHDGANLLDRPELTPLLVCDLWEHAYYLDHQNNRKGFLEAWFDHLADWRQAERQWRAAGGEGPGWRYPAPRA